MNSTYRTRWLASSEVMSQVLFTSEQPKKNKMTFVGKLSQIKLLFGSLVIQLAWYIIKQLFTSVSVKVVYIYLAASRIGKYPPLYSPPLRWIIVKYFVLQKILTHVKRMVRSGPAFCNCSLNLNFKIVNHFFFSILTRICSGCLPASQRIHIPGMISIENQAKISQATLKIQRKDFKTINFCSPL